MIEIIRTLTLIISICTVITSIVLTLLFTMKACISELTDEEKPIMMLTVGIIISFIHIWVFGLRNWHEITH